MAAGQLVGHQGEVALAEGDAIARAGHQVDEALIVFDTAHNAGDTSNRRERRVVGMHGHFYASLFGDGHRALQKIAQVFPLFVLGDDAVLGEGLVP